MLVARMLEEGLDFLKKETTDDQEKSKVKAGEMKEKLELFLKTTQEGNEETSKILDQTLSDIQLYKDEVLKVSENQTKYLELIDQLQNKLKSQDEEIMRLKLQYDISASSTSSGLIDLRKTNEESSLMSFSISRRAPRLLMPPVTPTSGPLSSRTSRNTNLDDMIDESDDEVVSRQSSSVLDHLDFNDVIMSVSDDSEDEDEFEVEE